MPLVSVLLFATDNPYHKDSDYYTYPQNKKVEFKKFKDNRIIQAENAVPQVKTAHYENRDRKESRKENYRSIR